MHGPDLNEQALLQASRAQRATGLSGVEKRAELVVGGLSLAAMILLWLFPLAGTWSPLPAVACAGCILLCRFIRFDVGGGFTVPVQVGFVPLLFTIPAQAVPIAVLALLMAGRLIEVLRRHAPAVRVTVEVGNAAFAIGPAAVLVALGGADALERHPALAVLVIGAQFLSDFVLTSLREALVRGATIAEQLREAAWVYGVDAALTPAPLWLAIHEGSVTAVVTMLSILGLLATFARERELRIEGMFELSNAYQGTALLLGDVVEADDSYTGEHCKGVVQLALDVGRELQLDAAQMRNLEFAALLHDVGKVAIPKEIINKPGKLDPREWAVIKTHTVEGQRMLDRIGGFMGEVGRIVRSHHERWDGGGYPDGLAGEQIPFEARIVTACDSYSAMTTDRSYRKAMPVSDALAELRTNSGTQLDPRVVTALVALVERSELAVAPVRRAA